MQHVGSDIGFGQVKCSNVDGSNVRYVLSHTRFLASECRLLLRTIQYVLKSAITLIHSKEPHFLLHYHK